jgi:hypothetical protein
MRGPSEKSQTFVGSAVGKVLGILVEGLFVKIVGLLKILARFRVLALFVQRARTLGHSGHDSNEK